MLPFVCMSILTSDVWNNEINIELLNILVHSRSKVEVFFWQTLPPPLPPTLFTNALCALASPIHHSASGRRKSTFPGWVFFSSASAAVSVGTRETLLMDTLVITGRELWDSLQPPVPSLHPAPSPPPISTSDCSTHLVFSPAPSFVPAVLCTPFWQWWLLYLPEFSLAKWLGLQRPATLRSRARASHGVGRHEKMITAWKLIPAEGDHGRRRRFQIINVIVLIMYKFSGILHLPL